jgi:hypothetical protein
MFIIAKGFEPHYQVIRTNRMQKLANVLINFFLLHQEGKKQNKSK